MKRRWLMLGFASMAAISAHAGTVVHMARRDLPDAKARPHTVIYAQAGQFRMDSLDDNGHVRDFVIVRDGNIWQVDVEKRTFYLFDKASLTDQQELLKGRMQEMLQRLPAGQRAAMEARMNAVLQHARQTDVAFTDTGRTDKVGSWACEVWQLKSDGRTVSDACIAPAGALTGGGELVKATHRAATIAADVLSSIPAAHAAAAHFAMFGTAAGFPVRTRDLGRDGTPDDEETVTSIEVRRLASDQFAIPKGFTQTSFGRTHD